MQVKTSYFFSLINVNRHKMCPIQVSTWQFWTSFLNSPCIRTGQSVSHYVYWLIEWSRDTCIYLKLLKTRSHKSATANPIWKVNFTHTILRVRKATSRRMHAKLSIDIEHCEHCALLKCIRKWQLVRKVYMKVYIVKL